MNACVSLYSRGSGGLQWGLAPWPHQGHTTSSHLDSMSASGLVPSHCLCGLLKASATPGVGSVLTSIYRWGSDTGVTDLLQITLGGSSEAGI